MALKLTKNDLNFRVYTASALPEAGLANDICVISDVPMSNWVLSPDTPSGPPRTDGDVWLRYSVNETPRNMLKNNTLMVAIISAHQYINGVWVDKTVKTYQNGARVDMVTYLYSPGNQHSDLTGGWTAEGYSALSSSVSAGEITADGTIGLYGADDVFDVLGTKNPIDLSAYSSITADAAVLSAHADGTSIIIAVCSQKQLFNNYLVKTAVWPATGGGVGIDVSDLTGEYYIVVYAGVRPECMGTVSEIKLHQ
jgi:hypothetical protein